MRTGQVRSGQARLGQVRSDQLRSCQVRSRDTLTDTDCAGEAASIAGCRRRRLLFVQRGDGRPHRTAHCPGGPAEAAVTVRLPGSDTGVRYIGLPTVREDRLRPLSLSVCRGQIPGSDTGGEIGVRQQQQQQHLLNTCEWCR